MLEFFISLFILISFFFYFQIKKIEKLSEDKRLLVNDLAKKDFEINNLKNSNYKASISDVKDKQIIDCKEEIFNKNKKIEELKKELTNFNEKHQANKKRISELLEDKKKIDYLEVSLDKFKIENDFLIERNKELIIFKDNNELENKYLLLENKYYSLSDKYDKCKERLDQLKNDLYDKNNENKFLTKENKRLLKFEDPSSYKILLKEFDNYVYQETKKINMWQKSIKEIYNNIRPILDNLILAVNKYKKDEINSVKEEVKKIYGDMYELKDKKDILIQEIESFNQVYSKLRSDSYITTSFPDVLVEFYKYGRPITINNLNRVKKEIKNYIDTGNFLSTLNDSNNDLNKKGKILLEFFKFRFNLRLKRLKSHHIDDVKKSISSDAREINNLCKKTMGVFLNPAFLKLHLEQAVWQGMLLEESKQKKELEQELREQLLEEQKVREEYDKKIKIEEEKEKQAIELYEKIKKELIDANQSDLFLLQEYEYKIKNLEIEIENHRNNQRQLSMAQQTKAGHVYIISNIGSFGEELFKIGLTRRLEPIDRVKELSNASVPFEYDIHAMIQSEDAPALEKQLHHYFGDKRVNKVNPRKEFFKLELYEVEKYLKSIGIEAEFLYKADAYQYNETLRIEQMSIEEKEKILSILENEEFDDEEFEQVQELAMNS